MPFFQPKLTIGPPGDRFEQEADRVADRIVAGETAPEVQRMCTGCAEEAEAGGELRRQPLEEEEELIQPSREGELRRQPAEEEEELVQPSRDAELRRQPMEEEEEMIQPSRLRRQPAGEEEREEERLIRTKPEGELRRQPMEEEEETLQPSARPAGSAVHGAPAGPGLASGIDGLHGGGRPLGRAERAFFEPRLGRDLSGVRLHTGPRAAALAESIDARAFTVGRDVVFGASQYAPAEREGRRLLAHELTHVVQQRGGPPVARRKVAFDKPTYQSWNPIDRIVRGEPDAGRTSPTIDGTEPADAAAARRLVFKALRPRSFSHDPKSGGCRFEDFDSSLSANVHVPTKPGRRGWLKYVEGADIKGSAAAAAACGSKRSVPVRMIGKPDHMAIVKRVESNEQEHVDDLEKVHKDRLETYFTDMLALRATDLDQTKCRDKLMAALGNKDGLAAKGFGDDWEAAVKARDGGGGHDLKSEFEVKGRCSRIKITSEPR